jgi:D-amino peptidase
MKIFIMTDVEGCAGVLNFADWTNPEARYYEKAKRFLTYEANAAISGLAEGGADEFTVIDGHGHGAIDPELLDERAILVRGHRENIWPWGLDKTYEAVAFVGQHAKAGTPYSHLTHTGNCRVIEDTINGISIGEYGKLALCAMELDIPVILACGERALTHEAEVLTPGVVTASVKEGLLPDNGFRDASMEEYRAAKLSAAHLSPEKARKVIRAAAVKAIEKLKSAPKSFKFPELHPPYKRIVEYRRSEALKDPAFKSVTAHPSSIAELLNQPINRENP